MAEKMFTLSELNRMTGKSRTTLRSWCENGKMSSIKDGDRLLISMSEVLRLFPTLTADTIQKQMEPDRKSKQKIEHSSTGMTDETAQNDRIAALEIELAAKEKTITDQRIELENLRMTVQSLQKQLELITEMKGILTDQIATFKTQFDVLTRLIPEKSSVKRERDAAGRFKASSPTSSERLEQSSLLSE